MDLIPILVGVIIGAILVFCYGFYVKDHKDPDGIIAVSGEEKIKANFILCIPIEEFLKRDRVIFEVRRIPEDSQKKQEA